MSNAWSWFVCILVLANIIGICWLLMATAKHRPEDDKPVETTGHEWDGLQELNMPLPKWWLYLFIATVVFGVIYLILYPGMGNFSGVLGWSQVQQYKTEASEADKHYAAVLDQYNALSITELSENADAMRIASRLFANNCSTCHGADARGAIGFPDLTDNDWLYGGSPEAIKQSIADGRVGVMPAMGAAINGDSGAYSLAVYLKNLNTPFNDPLSIREGEKLFVQFCTACHGEQAKGSQALGAPNLADDTWLYGHRLQDIQAVIKDGRQGNMPAHQDLLNEQEIHFLTAYIYGLSR